MARPRSCSFCKAFRERKCLLGFQIHKTYTNIYFPLDTCPKPKTKDALKSALINNGREEKPIEI